MKLLATAVLAVAALSHCASAAWTITPSNATQPEEIQGPHQSYVKVWTISGSQPLTAVKFSAAGLVFIDYDAKLNAAPTEAPTEAPVATTDAPTESPVVTTEAPTDAPTEAPVTEAPATEAPVTVAPVTEAPTTEAPVTEAPTTEAPTTEAPTTEAPTTEAPTTEAPPTEAPVTAAPTTEAPTTESPTEAPVTAGSGAGVPSGLVSLNEVASTVLAKVVFSGNCTKLLDELEVVERDGTLKIHFKNADFSGYGYILTQVYVGEKEVLSEVINAGSSSIFISENVVAASNSSAEVYIKTDGDGDIFVTAPSTAFTLKSLSTKISGAGNIQFSADSLTLGDSLESRVAGDGDIAIVAKKVDANNTISSKISGSGNIFVQADNVTTFKLKSKINGEGAITVSTNGSCVKQDVLVSGSGLIATGSIGSVDTTIRMSGEGSVLVQTSHKLLVPRSIYGGSVQYVGTAPQEITDGTKPRPITKKPKKPKHSRHHHFWFGWGDDDDDEDEDSDEDHDHDYEDDEHHLPKSVTQATENKYETYALRDAAPREATFLVLELRQNWWGDEPNARVVISIFGVDIGGSLVANTQAMAVRVQKQHPVVRGLFFMGFVAVALSAVVITFHKVVIGKRRREYQPLMQVVTSN